MRSKQILDTLFAAVGYEDLIDLKDIKIDENKPINERMRDYLDQIKDPYLFRVGDIVVRVKFAGEESLQTKIEEMMRSNLSR